LQTVYVYRPLWVLRGTVYPAVLVELGFLTNKRDVLKYVRDDDLSFKCSVAWSLFMAIDKHIKNTGETNNEDYDV